MAAKKRKGEALKRQKGATGERRRDPERVQARAVAAAIDEFAERGYEAGSLRGIARRAGLSQPLISYHFGSKRELWNAAKREVVARARTRLMAELAARADASDRVHAAMSAFFSHAAANPDARRIGLWAQLLGGDEHFEGEANMLRAVTGLVKEVQERGQLRDDIPAEHLVWIFRSAVYEWIGNRERICSLFGWDPDTPEVDAEFLDSLRRMAAR